MNHCVYVTCHNCGRWWCDRCESPYNHDIKPNLARATQLQLDSGKRDEPYYGPSCACNRPDVRY